MNKIKLLFGVHMHQPVDNLSVAVKNAVERCYLPFFKILKEFPEFKFSVHSSGWLLNEIKEKYHDVFDDILFLNEKGSLEFFTGGFYEPVLCSIPSKDRVKQIEKLNKTINDCFSQSPKGLWLTERVWEDSIISDLTKSGIKYLTVDDYHFIASGFKKEDLDGYFLTENSGEIISLFPINKDLRYSIPFKKVENTIKDIKKIYKNDNSAAIIFDDLEKFGLWPKTYSWVYEKKWLERFLEKILSDNEIETLHFSEYHSSYKAKGLAYLQNVSYFEMGKWSLKAEDTAIIEDLERKFFNEEQNISEKFIRGGIWKNFFVKYEESNRIHKRMLELSKQTIKSKKFKEELYKLQTNDVLWHGVFGGLYLPNLRDNAYRFLTNCENIRYRNENKIEVNDVDLNGFDEIKVVNENFVIRFDSHFGGQLVELLLRDKSFNLQNTLTRRKEAYHEKILNYEALKSNSDENEDEIDSIHNSNIEISEEIKNSLNYDWYVKNSFVDHISNESFTLENFKKCKFWEYGDFANQPFDYSIVEDKVVFNREGGIYFDNSFATTINKNYSIKENILDFDVNLKTLSLSKYIYALEFNIHFADLEKVFYEDYLLNFEYEFQNISNFTIKDDYLSKLIHFEFDREVKLYFCPLQTVSQNERGFELSNQGLSIAISFYFEKEFVLKGKLRIEDV